MKDKRDDLALETRRAIYEVVADFPGLHFREIVRRLGMSPSNVEYHLRYMVKHDLLTVVEDGKLKRFYVRGKVGHDEKVLLSVLRKEISRGIVLFLLLEPDSGPAEILEVFDLSPSQLNYHVGKLLSKGIIVDEDGAYRVVDEEKVASVIIAYRPTFMDVMVDTFVDAWLGRTQHIKGRKRA
ncbi:MAG: winged helix-turn-helix transcriptional regulator [Candidatus Thermoplasmatota archaeon]|nr:winged helix-turn-helix transcriptional regulator [Candidatus Thermoplasmatota archaeon]